MKGIFRAQWLKTALAFMLAACLLPGPEALAADRYPEKEHLPVDFADMACTGFDDTVLQEALSSLRQICASPAIRTNNAKTRLRLQSLYDQILQEVNLLMTQSALINIRYDANGAEEEAARESAALSEQVTRISDDCYLALQLLIDTPYQNIVERDAGESGIDFLRSYQKSPLRSALLQKEDLLVQSYDQAMTRPVKVTVDGRQWTEEALLQDSALSSDDYWKISALLEKERNRAAGEIYLQLLQVRTELAALSGCSSYTDYAYAAVYDRDYTTEDIQSVRQAAKDFWVDLELLTMEALSARELRILDMRSRAVGDEILDAIEPYMGRIDPELAKTFAFMREHHLYDIAPGENKLPVGYTIGLPAYGTAFIFDSPYGDHQDYNTAIHEFGHFNETFHSTEHDLWSDFRIDVGEIHSQGLEVLFTAYADELFGDGGRAFYWNTISNMVSSVLEGCMYDEFETAAYQNPDMTLDELNSLFKEISESYGYVYDDGEEAYFWVEISHLFQSPLYYISYATSALSALDLWLLSLEDWDRAVETYMDLTVLGMSRPYREAVETVGLDDIFQEETMQSLAEGVQARLSAEPAETGGAPDGGTLPPPPHALTPGSALLGGCVAAAVAVIVPLMNRRKQSAAENAGRIKNSRGPEV